MGCVIKRGKQEGHDERQHFNLPALAGQFSLPSEKSSSSNSIITKLRFFYLSIRLYAADKVASCRLEIEQEIAYGNLFLFVPVFLAAGVFLYYLFPFEPSFFLLVPISLLGLGLIFFTFEYPLQNIFLAALVLVVIGIFAASFETWRAQTRMLGAEISTQLTGQVVRTEKQESGRVRLVLDVINTDRPHLRYSPDRVRVTARQIPENLRPGDVVVGIVRLMPPSGPVRPQSYDFSFRSFFDGIGAIGFFLSNPVTVQSPEHDASRKASAWFESLRQNMTARIEQNIEGPQGAIAAALITGIRSGIPEEINEALRIVGLYHVISISGLHMALVAGTLMVGMRSIFALFPAFSMRWPVKKYSAVIALGATGFYLILSGADVAAQRSFIMLAVMLIAILFDRAALTMRNLAISAIIILLWSPHEVVGPSFQMSFAATAALIASYEVWTKFRAQRAIKAVHKRSFAGAMAASGLKYAAGLSMTSIVAGFATALFTAWHFQQISTLGLIANLAAMPFVSILVMPMAVIACIFMPFGLEGFPLYLMGVGIAAMNEIALWLAQYSVFDQSGAISLSAVMCLTAAMVIITMLRSKLIWLSVPFATAGFMLLIFYDDRPAIFISEDARLIAMELSDSTVAVNRARPNGFAIQNWMRAFAAKDYIKPDKVKDLKALKSWQTESSFKCSEELCLAQHESGAIVAYAENETAASSVCDVATVVVINDATATLQCNNKNTLLVTKRDLALYGSAEIKLHPTNKKVVPEISYAIAQPYRPWHQHRQFSRAARGLEEIQRARK